MYKVDVCFEAYLPAEISSRYFVIDIISDWLKLFPFERDSIGYFLDSLIKLYYYY